MKSFFVIAYLALSSVAYSQSMSNTKLNDIYTTVSDSIEGNFGQWKFSIDEIMFLAISDPTNNRMRIISPIIEADRVDEKLSKAALIANFHTALDVKYAIADNVLWACFIHPLKELTEAQVKDAISQVYYANKNFGTTFSSTALIFPGRSPNQENMQKADDTPKTKRF